MTFDNYLNIALASLVFGGLIMNAILENRARAEEIRKLRAQVARLAVRYQRAAQGQPGAWMTTDHMRAITAEELNAISEDSRDRLEWLYPIPLYTDRPEELDETRRKWNDERDYLRERLAQADLKIRSFPGTDQSDVEFIREALIERKQP